MNEIGPATVIDVATSLRSSVTRSHVKTRLWTNLDLENKGLDLATEGFDATSSHYHSTN